MSFEIRRLKEEHSRKSTILRSLLPVLRPMLQWILLRQQQQKEKEHRHRIITIIIAGVCAAVLLAVAWNLLQTLRAFSLQTILSAGSTTIAEDVYGQTNILLLGNGDSTHDGVDLIDSIIIASLDRKTESIALLSLPRDLYFLHTDDMGAGRLNSLYRDEKYALKRKGLDERDASMAALRTLAKEISTALSIEIHHVVKADFMGFIAAVDAIGGIPIDIPADITDPSFPGPEYTTETFSIRKGRQTLDGQTALKYARSRSTTSDFDRSVRQQLLLDALGKHLRAIGILTKPNKLLALFNIVNKHIATTLSLRELLTLAKIGKGFRSPQILQMHLSDRNGLYGEILEPGGFLYAPPRDQFDGASVLLPISHPEFPVTWKQLQILTNLFLHERSLYRMNPSISLLNAGAPPGSARLLADELLRYGFSIETIGNTPFQKQETSFVLDSGQRELEASFGSLLRLPVHAAPLPASPRTTTSLSIVLGKDYRFVHLQDLPPSAL
ncbi:LCP family protein [Candidatus Peregrinibacteria bacterium]|nr:LCP family protein [Candidatus Peregrinibacteria bacterium]